MLISTRGIEKSYPVGVARSYVLRRINVDIKESEFVSIMGPSGAGKSTLLHIFGMHDSAWTGEYYFMYKPVCRLNPIVRADDTRQQKIVGATDAASAYPQLILHDEPTGNLYSAQGKEIMELFRTLNESGTTIVQVTHSEVNASYGTRIIQLRDGWVVDD